jgi:hypothetical protein
VYFAGAGGTVYYRDGVDGPNGAVHHIAFFGPLSTYLANQAAYDSSVFIDTPLTSDSRGDIYFGFRVVGQSPLCPLWSERRIQDLRYVTGDPNLGDVFKR